MPGTDVRWDALRPLAATPARLRDCIDGDDEVDRYTVVRIADEIVVDLTKFACGVQYAEAADHIERLKVNGVRIPVADKYLLIRTKTPYAQAMPLTSAFYE